MTFLKNALCAFSVCVSIFHLAVCVKVTCNAFHYTIPHTVPVAEFDCILTDTRNPISLEITSLSPSTDTSSEIITVERGTLYGLFPKNSFIVPDISSRYVKENGVVTKAQHYSAFTHYLPSYNNRALHICSSFHCLSFDESPSHLAIQPPHSSCPSSNLLSVAPLSASLYVCIIPNPPSDMPSLFHTKIHIESTSIYFISGLPLLKNMKQLIAEGKSISTLKTDIDEPYFFTYGNSEIHVYNVSSSLSSKDKDNAEGYAVTLNHIEVCVKKDKLFGIRTAGYLFYLYQEEGKINLVRKQHDDRKEQLVVTIIKKAIAPLDKGLEEMLYAPLNPDYPVLDPNVSSNGYGEYITLYSYLKSLGGDPWHYIKNKYVYDRKIYLLNTKRLDYEQEEQQEGANSLRGSVSSINLRDTQPMVDLSLVEGRVNKRNDMTVIEVNDEMRSYTPHENSDAQINATRRFINWLVGGLKTAYGHFFSEGTDGYYTTNQPTLFTNLH